MFLNFRNLINSCDFWSMHSVLILLFFEAFNIIPIKAESSGQLPTNFLI